MKRQMVPIRGLRELIAYFGTQAEIARVLDVTPQFVNKLFIGQKDLPLLKAMKITELTKGRIATKNLLSESKRQYLKG